MERPTKSTGSDKTPRQPSTTPTQTTKGSLSTEGKTYDVQQMNRRYNELLLNQTSTVTAFKNYIKDNNIKLNREEKKTLDECFTSINNDKNKTKISLESFKTIKWTPKTATETIDQAGKRAADFLKELETDIIKLSTHIGEIIESKNAQKIAEKQSLKEELQQLTKEAKEEQTTAQKPVEELSDEELNKEFAELEAEFAEEEAKKAEEQATIQALQNELDQLDAELQLKEKEDKEIAEMEAELARLEKEEAEAKNADDAELRQLQEEYDRLLKEEESAIQPKTKETKPEETSTAETWTDYLTRGYTWATSFWTKPETPAPTEPEQPIKPTEPEQPQSKEGGQNSGE